MVLRVDTKKDSHFRVTQKQWFMDKRDLTKAVIEEQQGLSRLILLELPIAHKKVSARSKFRIVNYKDAKSRKTVRCGARQSPRNTLDLPIEVHSKLFGSVRVQEFKLMTL